MSMSFKLAQEKYPIKEDVFDAFFIVVTLDYLAQLDAALIKVIEP